MHHHAVRCAASRPSKRNARLVPRATCFQVVSFIVGYEHIFFFLFYFYFIIRWLSIANTRTHAHTHSDWTRSERVTVRQLELQGAFIYRDRETRQTPKQQQ
jgi:hypothetical protein